MDTDLREDVGGILARHEIGHGDTVALIEEKVLLLDRMTKVVDNLAMVTIDPRHLCTKATSYITRQGHCEAFFRSN